MTRTTPCSTVNVVVKAAPRIGPACAVVWSTSVITTVPRMPATAFGVLMSMDSPGFMRSLTTARATRPIETLSVEAPGASVRVRTERSRTVTIALPPSRMRATEASPVVMRSCTNTASLNLSGSDSFVVARTTVAVPCSVVTTPAFVSWAGAGGGQASASASSEASAVSVASARVMPRPPLTTDHEPPAPPKPARRGRLL